ncbi:MAG: Uncharacterized protein FD162_668 [Rhodobacteraceae bacterium]|uniref:hypothetical protein n=1 Tax=Cypionkella sp. TaxID=2811411 RepID=UPI0013278444|nr:hypothetical protein [Cypionkella sp.]KAF0175365.1 MAG: Uncharacterized protein FD162_668 [Paracoccaceae bacterium]MDO8325913.1 hypothetical protein [Cypionkella sp.]
MPAMKLLQSYLDQIGTAVLVGDWDTYRAHVELPFTLITETATLNVDTEEDLRKGFDSFYDMLKFQKVTQYIRLADSAVDLSDTLIVGRYVSHFIAGAHRIIPPFRSTMTLRLIGNRWRAVAITNSISNMQWPIQVPRVDQPLKGADK